MLNHIPEPPKEGQIMNKKRFYKPRFTEDEAEDAKALLKFFPDADAVGRTAGNLSEEDSPELYVATSKGKIIRLNDRAFPSLLPGQSVQLSEICGGEADA